MADRSPTTAPTEATTADAIPTRPAEPVADITSKDSAVEASVDVTKSAEPATADDSALIPSAPDTSDELVASTTIDTAKENGTDAPVEATSTNGTPASAKKGGVKRKSVGGVPEHNKKKGLSRKKSMATLQLEVEAGQYWFVAMRGFPAWPVIVCDEEMLPESLLSKRPVSAKRLDGTYREDFQEGGKNVKDRRYPIMFMGTNEFSWQVNTDLQHLDLDTVKKEVEAENQGKKSKALWNAYQVAAEGHDLAWFKTMLADHEKATVAEAEAAEQAAELAASAKKEKKEKAARRKSAPTADTDVEMEDVDGEAAPKKSKATKKRKKDAESDADGEKPAKTPKTKLKLTNKTPKEEPAIKPKKTPKPKKVKAASEEEEEEDSAKAEEKPMTEEERKEKREKGVLYLRHRLQKGFLTRDQTPKEEEMATMSGYFEQLENYTDLEGDIIRRTKIHKVLKAIIKLNSIPREDHFNFKKRSSNLLDQWATALSSDMEAPVAAPAAAPVTNGVHHEDKPESKTEEPAAPEAEAPVPTTEAAPEKDADGDEEMTEAKEAAPVVAPAAVVEPTASA